MGGGAPIGEYPWSGTPMVGVPKGGGHPWVGNGGLRWDGGPKGGGWSTMMLVPP